ncbi:16S rRNA (uracil(1498)-N(3))-methyltransferase [bacterium]|nr:16S rRNA (uracil(1498)-N(3))-methyltransferase [bacterium]
MPHFFITSEQINDNIITISDKENYQHIARSLRARCGESLLLVDENQIQYETKIKEITGSEIFTEIKNSYPSKRFLDFSLYLAQSPLRSDAQGLLIEKATELGVAAVFPVFTDNCALNKSVAEKKIPKWNKIMYEASKQCERANVPYCSDLTSIDKVLSENEFDKVFVFCERIADKTIRDSIIENPINKNDKVLVIIGPEGGFSQQEFDYFKEKNLEMLTLGELILKAETATVVALGNIIYEYSSNKK